MSFAVTQLNQLLFQSCCIQHWCFYHVAINPCSILACDFTTELQKPVHPFWAVVNKSNAGLGGYYVAGPPLLNGRCTSLLSAPRLRNNLYCVEWDVKRYYTIPYRFRYRVCHTDPWPDLTLPKSSTRWPVTGRSGSNTASKNVVFFEAATS